LSEEENLGFVEWIATLVIQRSLSILNMPIPRKNIYQYVSLYAEGINLNERPDGAYTLDP
jgi:hypothetical protein